MGMGQQFRIYLHKCTMGDMWKDACKYKPHHVFRYFGKEANIPPSKVLFHYRNIQRYAHMEIYSFKEAFPYLLLQRNKTRCAYTILQVDVEPLNRK
ncbi:hypothetical protein CTM50_04505 [Prevotella intermedia]|uniref:Uncharacterized protein n=1 Tax=Prevotella intermedia TaxID=28131 RepID=A0A2D3NAA7_PREIN|nr:hypothetical protein CTM50_04505 [Prevotella intermedia]